MPNAKWNQIRFEYFHCKTGIIHVTPFEPIRRKFPLVFLFFLLSNYQIFFWTNILFRKCFEKWKINGICLMGEALLKCTVLLGSNWLLFLNTILSFKSLNWRESPQSISKYKSSKSSKGFPAKSSSKTPHSHKRKKAQNLPHKSKKKQIPNLLIIHHFNSAM